MTLSLVQMRTRKIYGKNEKNLIISPIAFFSTSISDFDFDDGRSSSDFLRDLIFIWNKMLISNTDLEILILIFKRIWQEEKLLT